jgi:hypothetical protein
MICGSRAGEIFVPSLPVVIPSLMAIIDLDYRLGRRSPQLPRLESCCPTRFNYKAFRSTIEATDDEPSMGDHAFSMAAPPRWGLQTAQAFQLTMGHG